MSANTDDLRIRKTNQLISPEELINDVSPSERALETVASAREAIHGILAGEDDRLLVIVGPCSIHDPAAAREYATHLKAAADKHGADIVVVMRVYFEKPRTTVGWKGLINDPDLNNTFQINKGLHLARRLLLDLAELGLPAGTEYLDLISPQYYADLVSWGAIGARTTESQTHRELASGLSCPVGFKNATDGDIQVAVDAIRSASQPHHFLSVTKQGHSAIFQTHRELASGLSCPVGFKNATDGDIQVAVDAIRSASQPHHFLSVTKQGHSAIFQTAGNEDCHIILRGGKHPNYDMFSVDDASVLLEKAGLAPRIMIDASHANSRKIPARQVDVASDIATQVARGSRSIIGLMLESNLVEGRQDVVPGQSLTYGQSITDPCMSWRDTESLLQELATATRLRREG